VLHGVAITAFGGGDQRQPEIGQDAEAGFAGNLEIGGTGLVLAAFAEQSFGGLPGVQRGGLHQGSTTARKAGSRRL
jgi:hypothetical protein